MSSGTGFEVDSEVLRRHTAVDELGAMARSFDAVDDRVRETMHGLARPLGG